MSSPRSRDAAATPSAVALWRQRIAGGVFVAGGIVAIVAYFLPWTYAYFPPDRCPGCVPVPGPETRAPVDALANGLSTPTPDTIIWLALLAGLPLVFIVVGVRLLARREAVRLRWKALVILASIVAFCSTFLLAATMGFSYIDSALVVRAEAGMTVALVAPLAVLVGGIVMPTRRRTVRIQ